MNLSKQNAPATKKQLWALYCGTGLNTTNCTMTVRQASNLIENMKAGVDVESDLRSFGAIGKMKPKAMNWEEVYKLADKAGKDAVKGFVPVPMVVEQKVNPLDDSSATQQSYYVPDGVCGFASVHFKGNTSFGRWAVKNNVARKSIQGGCYISVFDYNQSMQKKYVYAVAFANVLKENGVEAYATQRMD